MKKAILKRTADALERMAIGSALIGIFQQVSLGVNIGIGSTAASMVLTM